MGGTGRGDGAGRIFLEEKSLEDAGGSLRSAFVRFSF